MTITKLQASFYQQKKNLEDLLDYPYKLSLKTLEETTFPLNPEKDLTTTEKVIAYSEKALTGALHTALLPITLGLHFTSLLIQDEVEDFSSPLSPLNREDIKHLPKEIGVATAEYQVSGAVNLPNTNWAKWEEGKFEDGTPHILNNDKSSKALDHWNNPLEVINRLKELGCKHYRFSIDRSLIEVSKGQFSHLALRKYLNFIRQLKANDIEPMVVLHHFSDPLWFSEEGGFEKKENIESFINYCKFVFEPLSLHVKKWATFNEPAVYATQGYLMGEFPPGKTDPDLCSQVLENMLDAHCKVYKALKAALYGQGCQIGITHNVLRFRPYHSWNPIEKIVCHHLTKFFNDTVMNFFKNNEYRYQVPFLTNRVKEYSTASKSLDFFGLQYYSDPLISMELSKEVMTSSHYPNETMTNMPYRFYPEGLKTALDECRELNKPIYITEIGIDTNDKERRDFFDKVFKVASNALKEGIDLRGIYVWTLEDNFEWNYGWKNKFGIYNFSQEDQTVKMKDIGNFFQSLFKELKAI